MVSFTQQNFNFNKDNYVNWFNVLCKYYTGVYATVTVDNAIYPGTIGIKFFNQLPYGDNYHVSTKVFWSERASVKVLPEFTTENIRHEFEFDLNSTDRVLEIAKTIDTMMQSRLHHGCKRYFISELFELNGVHQYEIIEATKHLKTSQITRMYQGSCYIIFVLCDKYIVIATTQGIFDGNLPEFDLNKGFINTFGFYLKIANELNKTYFTTWYHKFIESDGSSWDDPIIM